MIIFKIRRAPAPPKISFIERRYGPELDTKTIDVKATGPSGIGITGANSQQLDLTKTSPFPSFYEKRSKYVD